MKTIALGSKSIILDVEDELRVKHYRKILPIINNPELDDMGKAIEFVTALSAQPEIDRETTENLKMDEFGILSEEIANLVNVEKKTEESLPSTPAKP